MYVLIIALDGNESSIRIISKDSLEYPEYILSGYNALKEGTKKECLEHWEEISSESIDLFSFGDYFDDEEEYEPFLI